MNISVIEKSRFFSESQPPVTVREAVHQGTVSYHSHSFFEFVFVVSGFSMHSYNNTTSLLTAGDLFAIRPGDAHCYNGAYNNKVYNCLFCEEALKGDYKEIMSLPGTKQVFDKYGPADWPRIHLNPAEMRDLQKLFDRIIEEKNSRRSGWELNIKSLLVQFLVFFSRQYDEHYISEGRNDRQYLDYVRRALGFVEENYNKNFSVRDMAKSTGVSADYLTRQFRQVIGITPVEYIRNFRFAKAMDMLKSEDLKISDISARAGFNSFSHFTREFRSVFGITPTEYKKNNKINNKQEQM